jgi:hypothetical protein
MILHRVDAGSMLHHRSARPGSARSGRVNEVVRLETILQTMQGDRTGELERLLSMLAAPSMGSRLTGAAQDIGPSRVKAKKQTNPGES